MWEIIEYLQVLIVTGLMIFKYIQFGPVLFIIVVSVLERVTPNYDWRKNYISELSLGKYGWVQRLNFWISGISVFGLCQMMSAASKTELLSFGWQMGSLLGLVMIAAGVWNTDPRGTTKPTTSGRLHDWTFHVGMFGIFAAYILVGWGYLSRAPLITVVTWGIAVFDLVWWRTGHRWKIPIGISQRIVMYLALLWLDVIAIWTIGSFQFLG